MFIINIYVTFIFEIADETNQLFNSSREIAFRVWTCKDNIEMRYGTGGVRNKSFSPMLLERVSLEFCCLIQQVVL